MPEIDRRVRTLAEMLMERGFGWLAAEIVQTIEAGHQGSYRDANVSSQRAALNSRIGKRIPDEIFGPDQFRSSATQREVIPRDFTADEQLALAINLLIDRLSAAAEMEARSLDDLTAMMDTQVQPSFEV